MSCLNQTEMPPTAFLMKPKQRTLVGSRPAWKRLARAGWVGGLTSLPGTMPARGDNLQGEDRDTFVHLPRPRVLETMGSAPGLRVSSSAVG